MEPKMIGDKIAEARIKINISQAQLAQQLFISPQAVGKWERGESLPDIITLNRLAKMLGVDLNYFSEDFPSGVNENSSAGSFIKPSADLPSVKQKSSPGWDMSRGNWVDADFSILKNLHDKFSSSNMQRCLFIGSDMSGLLLKSNHVENCDFSDSDFSNSNMQKTYLSKNLFKGCSLKEAEFAESYISGCDFTGADFTRAVFKYGGFEKNTLANTVLNRTSFVAIQLIDLVFEGTLEDCYFENCKFMRVTFQNSTLINTFFKCRNLKRIRFVDCKVDKMTYAFLKNGKADLSGITLSTT